MKFNMKKLREMLQSDEWNIPDPIIDYVTDGEAELREHIKHNCSHTDGSFLVIDGKMYIEVKEILGE